MRLIEDGSQRRGIRTTCIDVYAKPDTPAFALPRLVGTAIERRRATAKH